MDNLVERLEEYKKLEKLAWDEGWMDGQGLAWYQKKGYLATLWFAVPAPRAYSSWYLKNASKVQSYLEDYYKGFVTEAQVKSRLIELGAFGEFVELEWVYFRDNALLPHI